jgi:hypothetical protein
LLHFGGKGGKALLNLLEEDDEEGKAGLNKSQKAKGHEHGG